MKELKVEKESKDDMLLSKYEINKNDADELLNELLYAKSIESEHIYEVDFKNN